MSKIIDCIADITLEAVRTKITECISDKKVKQCIKNYLDKQKKLNFHISNEEEIDFEGLANYILTDLIKDVKQWLYGSRKERGDAYSRILSATATYASANTQLSKNRAKKIVGTAINIIKKYYRKKLNRDLLFLAGEINNTVEFENKKTRNFVANKIQHVEEMIKNNSELSIDSAIKKIEDGNISEVQKNFSTYINAISSAHRLFPDFGFRMTPENEIISYPLSDSAITKYPEKIKITDSTTKLGDNIIKDINKSVLEQSYRHQLPISINIKNACKYLGNIVDPSQSIAKKLIGSDIIINPPSFPPAFPCKVSVENTVVVPYLLLRVKEILDDDSFILTNFKFRCSRIFGQDFCTV